MSETTERDDRRKSATAGPPFAPGSALESRPSAIAGVPAVVQAACVPLASIPVNVDPGAGRIPLMQELELERQRIAMDLHDGLGPLITLIKLELHNAKMLMNDQWNDLAPARAAIQRAEENVARTFEELRRAVRDLRPAILDDLGIVQALRWLIRQFELSGTDVNIQSEFKVDDGAVPVALKIVIFRICQEMLNNVIKHAHANLVVVELDITGTVLALSIADDGRGMAAAPADILQQPGAGLAGIALRAHGSDGELTVDSAAGRGTRVTVCWQLPPASPPGDVPTTGDDNPLPSII